MLFRNYFSYHLQHPLGDEEIKALLEQKSDSFDPVTYWSNIHPHLPSVIAYQNVLKAGAKSTTSNSGNNNKDARPLHNIYENQPSGRQLSETADEFLARLPPRTTSISEVGPWIFVANPFPDAQKGKNDIVDQDIAGLTQEGHRLLEQYEQMEKDIQIEMEKEGKGKIALGKKLAPVSLRYPFSHLLPNVKSSKPFRNMSISAQTTVHLLSSMYPHRQHAYG